jgi:hypothetical protein
VASGRGVRSGVVLCACLIEHFLQDANIKRGKIATVSHLTAANEQALGTAARFNLLETIFSMHSFGLSPPELAVGVPVDRGPDRPVDFPAPQGLPGPKPAGASNSETGA